MACISAAKRTYLLNKLKKKTAQLEALEAAYLVALGNSEIERYTFDSGDGRQSTTRRSPEALQKLINTLESEIELIQRQLTPSGLVNMNLRRG